MYRLAVFGLTVSTLLLGGCNGDDKQIVADLSFAATSQGWLNNSFAEAGHIYYINVDNGRTAQNAGSGVVTCNYIGGVEVSTADFNPISTTRGSLSASQIQGVTISASWIPAAQAPNVALDIGRRSTVQLTNYVTRELKNTNAIFARAMATRLTPGQMQAVAESPSAAFALVYIDISADSADYYVGDINANTGNGVTVAVGGVNVKATVTSNSTQNWKIGKVIIRAVPFRVKKSSPTSETYVPVEASDALKNQIRQKLTALWRACL
jgi:hypothetical protein